MSDESHSPISPLAHSLGRIPSGLYILTVRHGGRSTGLLTSWVQQAGFAPPAVTVAIAGRRFVADWVRAERRFTLNQLPHGSKSLIRHFGRGFEPDAPAFEGLTLLDRESAGPVLAGAMAYLDAEVTGEVEAGDHRIVLAKVTAGAVLDPEAEPLVHVRHNGFHY